jgi:hypothetical protein
MAGVLLLVRENTIHDDPSCVMNQEIVDGSPSLKKHSV